MVLARIDAWWRAFEAKTEDLEAYFSQGQRWDLARWMRSNLDPIDPRLMWEFGPGSSGGHRLVITPETERQLRPLVDVVLERAPELDGWEFHAYRLREGVEEAHQMLEARGLISISGAQVVVAGGRDHLIDLTIRAPAFEGPEDRRALNSAFVASEVLLGEKILDNWVGRIAVEQAGQGVEGVAVSELAAAVDREISSIKAALPPEPAWQRADLAFSLWSLEPEERDDYPRQLDLFVGKSAYPEMWVAAHSGALFASERFSLHGEVFCYVKMDGSVDLSEERFADKSEIEDALDAALRRARVGAVIGGGTGRRYSYVDLALTDLDRGVVEVVRVLQEAQINRRTWILFYDDIYETEWRGVWPDSPPPPGGP